jgi:hypothetical protein
MQDVPSPELPLLQLYIDKRWINLEMVAEGCAWHFVKYNAEPRLR